MFAMKVIQSIQIAFGGTMNTGTGLFLKDPVFTFFYLLGFVYMIGALLAGLYITYDWWKEKKNKRGGEE